MAAISPTVEPPIKYSKEIGTENPNKCQPFKRISANVIPRKPRMPVEEI